MPHTHAHVRTALGLGHCRLDQAMVLIGYRSEDLRLHRPTIADAEQSQWYRPHPDPVEVHGWTEPLAPNLEGLSPQPEVVHRDVIEADGNVDIVLPIYLTSTR